MQKGSLYTHIDSKADLLWDVAREGAAAFHAALDARAGGRAGRSSGSGTRCAPTCGSSPSSSTSRPCSSGSGATSRASGASSSSPSAAATRSGSARSSARGASAASCAPDLDDATAALLALSAANWAYTWLRPGRDTDELADRFTALLLDGMRGYAIPPVVASAAVAGSVMRCRSSSSSIRSQRASREAKLAASRRSSRRVAELTVVKTEHPRARDRARARRARRRLRGGDRLLRRRRLQRGAERARRATCRSAFFPAAARACSPRALGLPRDPVAAARRLAEAIEQDARAGSRSAASNGRRFAFAAGVGLDAAAVRRVDALGPHARTASGRATSRSRSPSSACSAANRGHLEPALEVKGIGRAAFVVRRERDAVHVRRSGPAARSRRRRSSSSASTSSRRSRVRRRALPRLARYVAAAGHVRETEGHAVRPRSRPDRDHVRPARLPLQVDGEDLGDVEHAVFEAERDALASSSEPGSILRWPRSHMRSANCAASSATGDPIASSTALGEQELLDLYRSMVLLRTYDERSVVYHRQGRIGTYAIFWNHEAMQAGSVHALDDEDWIFPSYRESAIGLLRGMPPSTVLQLVARPSRGLVEPGRLQRRARSACRSRRTCRTRPGSRGGRS